MLIGCVKCWDSYQRNEMPTKRLACEQWCVDLHRSRQSKTCLCNPEEPIEIEMYYEVEPEIVKEEVMAAW